MAPAASSGLVCGLPLLLALLLGLPAAALATEGTTDEISPAAARPRVAVVGAGIGGASFAAFLREELEELGAGAPEITVFEQSDRLGGRTLVGRALSGKILAARPALDGAAAVTDPLPVHDDAVDGVT